MKHSALSNLERKNDQDKSSNKKVKETYKFFKKKGMTKGLRNK